MHSWGQGPTVQGRGVQAAALADALASLGRTRARMASLTAYGNGGRSLALGEAGAGGAGKPSEHPGELRGSAPGRVRTEGRGVQRSGAWAGGRGGEALRGWSCLKPGKGVLAEGVDRVKTPEM